MVWPLNEPPKASVNPKMVSARTAVRRDGRRELLGEMVRGDFGVARVFMGIAFLS